MSKNLALMSLSEGDLVVAKNKDDLMFLTLGIDFVKYVGKTKIKNIEEQSANIPSNKSNREIGVKVGSLCPICKNVLLKIGGCNTCTLCNAQLKWDINFYFIYKKLVVFYQFK